jgi:cytochrome P450
MVAATIDKLKNWQDGQTIDIAAEMMDLTMQIVYRTIFGERTSRADEEAKQAITLLQKYSGEMLTGASTITEVECDAAKKTLHTVVDELIAEHRSSQQSDFLDLLVNAIDPDTGSPMSDEQIRAEAINFYIAGQETSANALAWTWYMLAEYPDIQERLHHEVANVLGENKATSDSLAQMTYTECVIKESMRILPPAWLIGRRPTENVEINGYTIDPDATIAICAYVFHRNPAVFPDPERFDPDRFLAEPPRYTYLPFGAGPHVCIGQPFSMLETSLILTTMMQQFRIEPDYDHPIEAEPLITLRPKNGIKIRLNKRN